jgi:CheY-like chemotaxis protein
LGNFPDKAPKLCQASLLPSKLKRWGKETKMRGTEHAPRGQKILVVDDQHDLLNLLQICLSKDHNVVEVAADGLDALQKLSSNSYDLILTDIDMPNMDGNELCNFIRKACLQPEVPVVAITAEPWLATAEFNLVVNKPFRIVEIRQVVEDLLGRSGSVASIKW